MAIPVIDLFAGPGGLGEGFSSLQKNRNRVCEIKLSIEKDDCAHRTLELRAFYRNFPHSEVPEAYYDYLARRISRDELFNRFPDEAISAKQEAWHAELGSPQFPNKEIDRRIRAALGGSTKWILIGGPPCQAYSLVGRSRIIGGESLEHYEKDHRHMLYRRYLRIIAEHRPPVFVMENVKGLLSAKRKEKSTFAKILEDLEFPLKALAEFRGADSTSLSYRLIALAPTQGDLLQKFAPEDYVLRAEEYGVPQARHRVIILGIRSDIRANPQTLKKLHPVSIDEVISDLPKLRSGLSKDDDSAEAWRAAVQKISEALWTKNGNLSKDLRSELLKMCERVGKNLDRGAEFVSGISMPAKHTEWFYDPKLGGVCNHETRGHIAEDLHRYFFAAVFAQKFGRSPLLEDLPEELLPNHANVSEALKETKFNDRFRVQLKGRPSTTVVSHIAKDGHYYIHYDPTQCRSLTVREAARLQTFPDNYFFEGQRTQQYHQVGNAVPPLLARQIAEIVAEILI